MEDEIRFDIKELHELEEKNGRKFDYVRISSADMNGMSRTSVVPRKHLEEELLHGSYNFAGRMASDPLGNVLISKELQEVKYGNVLHIPCKGTLYNCSWVGLTDNDRVKWLVGEVLCEVKWPLHYREGSMMEECPRYALRKQLNRLKDMGYHLLSAFEMEFCLLNPDTLRPVSSAKNGALTQTLAKFEDFLYTIERSCQKSGCDIQGLKIEAGKGKFEFVMTPKYGIKTSDGAFVMKEAIKEISTSRGYLATFMSLPFKDSHSLAGHLNLSLWKNSSDGNKINAFFDANDPEHLSSVFRHFLAGLIKHGKALCAFWCPTINCYRRLSRFFVLPRLTWDFDNRKASFRIKKDDKLSPYLECRKISSICNHYLVTAATLVAGIDGIINQTPLPERYTDLFDMTAERETKEGNIKDDCLPGSLEEALDELEKNEVLKEGLGEGLVRWFVDLKRSKEIDVFKPLSEEEKWDKEIEYYLRLM